MSLPMTGVAILEGKTEIGRPGRTSLRNHTSLLLFGEGDISFFELNYGFKEWPDSGMNIDHALYWPVTAHSMLALNFAIGRLREFGWPHPNLAFTYEPEVPAVTKEAFNAHIRGHTPDTSVDINCYAAAVHSLLWANIACPFIDLSLLQKSWQLAGIIEHLASGQQGAQRFGNGVIFCNTDETVALNGFVKAVSPHIAPIKRPEPTKRVARP